MEEGCIYYIIRMNANILGKLSLNPIIYFMVPAMILTPFYTYHMAVSKGQTPPYPHVTVTDTATHYPQDIIFRYIMLFNSSFLALIFFIVFRWTQAQAKRIGYRSPPMYQFYLAEGSIGCYAVTIGTIDELGIGKLHGPCAIIFFVIWLVTIVNMTVWMTKMRGWDTSIMSSFSLKIKQLLSLYITALWAWCLYQISQQSATDKQDIYVVIVEWNSVMINLLWVLTMVMEWKDFKITLSNKK